MEASYVSKEDIDPLMAEISALCSDERIAEPWSSEELLSSCHLLLNATIPSTRPFLDKLGCREMTREASSTTAPLDNKPDERSVELSLSSSSSSFNSCESALEKTWENHRDASPPLRFHSCSSLGRQEEDGNCDITAQEENNSVISANASLLPMAASACSFGSLCQCGRAIASPLGQLDIGTGSTTDASQKCDSKILNSSHAKQANQQAVSSHDFDATKRGEVSAQLDHVGCIVGVPDEEREGGSCILTNNEESSGSFPSAMPSGTAVGAKHLREPSLPMRCVHTNEDAFLASASTGKEFVSRSPVGEKVAADVNHVSYTSNPQSQIKTKPAGTEELDFDSLSVYSGLPDPHKEPPGSAVEKMHDEITHSNAAAEDREERNDSLNDELINIPRDLTSFEILLFDVNTGGNLKYFPFSQIELETAENRSQFEDVGLENSSFAKSDDFSNCQKRRHSNLYYAAPASIREENSALHMPQCSTEEFLLSSLNGYQSSQSGIPCDNNTRINDLGAISDTLKSCNAAKPISSTIGIANNKIYNDIAFNREGNGCQKMQNFGRESDLVVSDGFGLVGETYLVECFIEKLIGKVDFLYGFAILSFPLFVSNQERLSLEKQNKTDLVLCLATSGKNWKLAVKSDGYPVVAVSLDDNMTSYSEWAKDDNLQSGVPNCLGKLYGFAVFPTENDRVKSLVPLFASPNLSKSAKDLNKSTCSVVTLRAKNPESFYGGHRNSATCDVQMYRGPDAFPQNEKEGLGREDNHVDPSFRVREVSFNLENADEETQNNEPASLCFINAPPVVLRSKSETKIKPFRKDHLEGAITPEKSNSLNGSAKASATNLSSFKGMTSPLEDDPSDVSKAAAFISSVVQQSLCPEKLSARISALKKTQNKVPIHSESDSISTSVVTPSSFSSSSSFSTPFNSPQPRHTGEGNSFISICKTHELPPVPNLKNAIAVNTIVSHLNASKKIFSTKPKIPLSCAPALVPEPSSPIQIGFTTSPNATTGPTTNFSPNVGLNAPSKNSDIPALPLATYSPPQTHEEAVSFLTSHITPLIKPELSTCVTTVAPTFISEPTQSFVSPTSYTTQSASQHNPMMSSLSIESSSVQHFPDSSLPGKQDFAVPISSGDPHSALLGEAIKCPKPSSNHGKSDVSLLSDAEFNAPVKCKPLPGETIDKITTNETCFDFNPKEDYFSTDFTIMDPSLDETQDNLFEDHSQQPGSLYRRMGIKNKAMDIAKQLKTKPSRHTYSTKFPLDIICQGRVLETKRKTVPSFEFSDEQRLLSLSQMQANVSREKEAYPTSRSLSTGRMELGTRRAPLTSLSLSEDQEAESKDEDDKNHLVAFPDSRTMIESRENFGNTLSLNSAVTEPRKNPLDSTLGSSEAEEDARSRLPKLRSSHSFDVKLVEEKDIENVIKKAAEIPERKSRCGKGKTSLPVHQIIEELPATTNEKEVARVRDEKKQFLYRDKLNHFANVITESILDRGTLLPMIRKKQREAKAGGSKQDDHSKGQSSEKLDSSLPKTFVESKIESDKMDIHSPQLVSLINSSLSNSFSEPVGNDHLALVAKEKKENNEEFNKLEGVDSSSVADQLPIIYEESKSSEELESTILPSPGPPSAPSTEANENLSSLKSRVGLANIKKVNESLAQNETDIFDFKSITDHFQSTTCNMPPKEYVKQEGDVDIASATDEVVHSAQVNKGLFQMSLPEPVKPLTFVVEESLEFIDEEPPFSHEEKMEPPALPSSAADDGAENIPFSTPSLAASLTFSISPVPATRLAEEAVTTSTTTAATTTVVKISTEGRFLQQVSSIPYKQERAG